MSREEEEEKVKRLHELKSSERKKRNGNDENFQRHHNQMIKLIKTPFTQDIMQTLISYCFLLTSNILGGKTKLQKGRIRFQTNKQN